MSEEHIDFYFHIKSQQSNILQNKINKYKTIIENKYNEIEVDLVNKERRLKYSNFAKNIIIYLEFMLLDNTNIDFNSPDIENICNRITEYLGSKNYPTSYPDNSYLNLLFTDYSIKLENTLEKRRFINTLYNIFKYVFKEEYININDILKIYIERNN